MRTIQEFEEELLFKEMRTEYWETHHSIPTRSDLENFEMGVMI